jgi:hypothetical protein
MMGDPGNPWPAVFACAATLALSLGLVAYLIAR